MVNVTKMSIMVLIKIGNGDNHTGVAPKLTVANGYDE